METNLSIILPCYNEEKNIIHVFNEFKKIQFSKEFIIELILVENGSTDNTEKEIDKNIADFNSENIEIKKVKKSKNDGYGGGIKAGINKSTGEFIAWAHADLQTPLEDIYKIFLLMKNDKNSFGKGYRTNNRGYDGIISRLHEKLASLILGQKMCEINAQPKIFHKSLIINLNSIPKKWTLIDTYIYFLALKNKKKIYEINVVFKNRIYGHSKWKNNFKAFLKHLFFNFVYLFKLRFGNLK